MTLKHYQHRGETVVERDSMTYIPLQKNMLHIYHDNLCTSPITDNFMSLPTNISHIKFILKFISTTIGQRPNSSTVYTYAQCSTSKSFSSICCFKRAR